MPKYVAKVGDLVRLREFTTYLHKDWHHRLGVVVDVEGTRSVTVKRLDTGDMLRFGPHEYDVAQEQLS